MKTQPPRVALANLPTPVEELARLSDELSCELRVKRDDLTGSHLTGNKIRKLEFLLAEAVARGATHVVTCGGAQSNHCRATALAARSLGLEAVLLLRTAHGEARDLGWPPVGNLMLDHLAGAELRTCSPETYARRDEAMADIARQIRRDGGRPYLIPEGGSNAVGALGYVRCAEELQQQYPVDLPDSVVVPVGSGGTVAGLAIGFKALREERSLGDWRPRVVGVAVCDDAATFRAVVHRISADASRRYGLPRLADQDFEILDGFVGRGYGLSTRAELELLRDTARRDGLVLDPVYTLKAFRGLVETCRGEPGRLGARILFVHTGGLMGLLAVADEMASVLRSGSG